MALLISGKFGIHAPRGIHSVSHALGGRFWLPTGGLAVFETAQGGNAGKLCGIEVIPNSALKALGDEQIGFAVNFGKAFTFLRDHRCATCTDPGELYVIHLCEEVHNTLEGAAQCIRCFIDLGLQLVPITLAPCKLLCQARQLFAVSSRPIVSWMSTQCVAQLAYPLIWPSAGLGLHALRPVEVFTVQDILHISGIAARVLAHRLGDLDATDLDRWVIDSGCIDTSRPPGLSGNPRAGIRSLVSGSNNCGENRTLLAGHGNNIAQLQAPQYRDNLLVSLIGTIDF